MFRKLFIEEIAVLQKNGCRANDWEQIDVADGFSPDTIFDCFFDGYVSIGSNVSLRRVLSISNYDIADNVSIFNVGELSSDVPFSLSPIAVMNENGGRAIVPFPDMTISDAYIFAKLRGRLKLQDCLRQFSLNAMPKRAYIGSGATIRNCQYIHNVIVQSSVEAVTSLTECVFICDGIVSYGSSVASGSILQRFYLSENVKVEYGARINDTIVGDNSTVARCEVGNSLIFPAHEQHHNNSFLIAANIQGQSNVAAGATIGSNHNGRTAEGELVAHRGFWPGLCSSFKHTSFFSSYCLLAKGSYPNELNITLPFSLVSNNVSADRLEIMPAFWWMYNIYALHRNEYKFAKRDKRFYRRQHIVFDPLAPDTVEEIVSARQFIRSATEMAYLQSLSNGGEKVPTIRADELERGRRQVVIIKAPQGYGAYEEMLYYYIGSVLFGDSETCPDMPNLDILGPRKTQWVNIGGQIVQQSDLDKLILQIEKGDIRSWSEVNEYFDNLWQSYPRQRFEHAYLLLCNLCAVGRLTSECWLKAFNKYKEIKKQVLFAIENSRQKDLSDVYRKLSFENNDEFEGVIGS